MKPEAKRRRVESESPRLTVVRKRTAVGPFPDLAYVALLRLKENGLPGDGGETVMMPPILLRCELVKNPKRTLGEICDPATSFEIFHLDANMLSSRALRYAERRQEHFGRYVVSVSMAEELVWRAAIRTDLESARNYLTLTSASQDNFVERIFDLLRWRYLGISKNFIVAQIMVMQVEIRRINLSCSETVRKRFIQQKEFYSIVDYYVGDRSHYVLSRKAWKPLTLDDETYLAASLQCKTETSSASILESTRISQELNKSLNRSANKSRNGSLHLNRTLKSHLREGRLEYLELSYFNDFAASVHGIMQQLSFNTEHDFLLFDCHLQKIIICSTMCEEFAFMYCPYNDIQVIREKMDEICANVVQFLDGHYTGFTREYVQNGLKKLIETLTSTKLALHDSRSFIEREKSRSQIFSQQISWCKGIVKGCDAREQLIAKLLNHGSNPEIRSAIEDIVTSKTWTTKRTLSLLPSIVIQWRRCLLRRDFSAIPVWTEYRRKSASDPEVNDSISVNQWRLVSYLIGIGCDQDKFSVMEDFYKILPSFCWRTKRHRNFELACLAICYDEIRAAAELLDGYIDGSRRRELVTIIFALRKILRAHLIIYNSKQKVTLASQGPIWYGGDQSGAANSHDPNLVKGLRLLTESVTQVSGAYNTLKMMLSLSARMDKTEEALMVVEEYLQRRPNDSSVLELATASAPTQHEDFNERLMTRCPWHDQILDWCYMQVVVKRQQNITVLTTVTKRLLAFLDFGSNKNQTEAWELLRITLSQIGDGELTSIKSIWMERRMWWPKFHLNIPLSRLRTLKTESIKRLEAACE